MLLLQLFAILSIVFAIIITTTIIAFVISKRIKRKKLLNEFIKNNKW